MNPDQTGTKAALHYSLTVPAGEVRRVRVRLRGLADPEIDADPGILQTTSLDVADDFDAMLDARRTEADEFYDAKLPVASGTEEYRVARQAFAGLLWGKQFYHYDVARWLSGDPGQPAPPPGRGDVRNGGWQHLDNHAVILMPDPWEYPWFAAWDLAFHCVTLAHIDAEFAKDQLILLLREWYMHPNGQLPAYEWNFSDVNPPVHAWAAIRVFEIDGRRDFAFLKRVFHKLLLNFTWWVNSKDRRCRQPLRRRLHGTRQHRAVRPIGGSAIGRLPRAGGLDRLDGHVRGRPARHRRCGSRCTTASYEDVATKFFEHFLAIGRRGERRHHVG